MASTAKVAQAALVELEQQDATADDQIVQAAIFAGINLKLTDLYKQAIPIHHGRAEWTLKWLLRKLARSAKGFMASFRAWKLLAFLIRTVPVRTAAKALRDRDFIDILKTGIEALHTSLNENLTTEISQTSKKRRRDGSLLAYPSASVDMASIRESIAMVMDAIIPVASHERNERTTFEAEHMISVVRTSGLNAAQIFGAWISCLRLNDRYSHESNGDFQKDTDHLLRCIWPIWQNREMSPQNPMFFATYCLQPVLALLAQSYDELDPGTDSTDTHDIHEAQNTISNNVEKMLEVLVLTNIILPAKVEFHSSGTAERLEELIHASLSKHQDLTRFLFATAVAVPKDSGIQPRKRRDILWLQAVFNTCREILAQPFTEDTNLDSGFLRNCRMSNLLQLCFQSGIKIESAVLEDVTREWLTSVTPPDRDREFAEAVACVIKMDVNVFFQPSGADLLEYILQWIYDTHVLSALGQPIIDNSDIFTLIIKSFVEEGAVAKQLPTIIQIWHEQLKRFPTQKHIQNPWEFALASDTMKTLDDALTEDAISDIVRRTISQTYDTNDVERSGILLLSSIVRTTIRQETREAIGMIIFEKLASLNFISTLHPYSGHVTAYLNCVCEILSWKMPQSITEEWQLSLQNVVLALANASLHATTFDSQCVLGLVMCACKLRSLTWNQALEDMVNAFMDMIARSFSAAIEELKHPDVAVNLEASKDNTLPYLSTFPVPAARAASHYLGSILCVAPEILIVFKDSESMPWTWIIDNILGPAIWLESARPEKNSKMWTYFDVSAGQGSFLPSLLREPRLINDTHMLRPLIDVLLKCGDHVNNPVSPGPWCNTTALQHLHAIPVELFSRQQRTAIIQSFQPRAHAAQLASSIPSEVCSPVDPMLLSLKARIMAQQTPLDGAEWQRLIELGWTINYEQDDPTVKLWVLNEYASKVLCQVMATIDQSRSQQYMESAWLMLDEFCDEISPDNPLGYTTISLFTTLLRAIKQIYPNLPLSLSIRDKVDVDRIELKFKSTLLANIRDLLAVPNLLNLKTQHHNAETGRGFSLKYSLQAVDTMFNGSITPEELTRLSKNWARTIRKVSASHEALGSILKTFHWRHSLPYQEDSVKSLIHDLPPDRSFDEFHATIIKTINLVEEDKDNNKMLHVLIEAIRAGVDKDDCIEPFLIAFGIIPDCQDTREDFMTEDGSSANLSMAYGLLSANLTASTSIKKFCMISELMELMLSTKGRCICQYNIDTTLSAISIACSPSGLFLPPEHASVIFQHLCRVFQTVLMSHRLKLQGHLHLVVQTLQALLRCLHTPVSTEGLTDIVSPAWLKQNPQQLTAKDAQSFTRLLQLLCDPTTSSVSRSSTTSLNSATAHAKHLVAQHIPGILTTYIKLQLDLSLKMQPDVREELKPGIWAVFSTMSVEGRKVLGESLDASGRVVLGGLVREFLRDGKWHGS